jgi:hypothetical protein
MGWHLYLDGFEADAEMLEFVVVFVQLLFPFRVLELAS